MVQKKDIVLWIIISVVTLGIAGIVWFIQLTNDVGKVSGDSDLSGGKCFLLTIITCGIYGFFWAYKMGKAMEIAGQKNNKPISDNSILYLILQIFGLSIVTYILVQNDLNNNFVAEGTNA